METVLKVFIKLVFFMLYNNLYVHLLYLSHYLSHLICSQPAVNPPLQKARSAPQAPRDTSPVNLGPKGVCKL